LRRALRCLEGVLRRQQGRATRNGYDAACKVSSGRPTHVSGGSQSREEDLPLMAMPAMRCEPDERRWPGERNSLALLLRRLSPLLNARVKLLPNSKSPVS